MDLQPAIPGPKKTLAWKNLDPKNLDPGKLVPRRSWALKNLDSQNLNPKKVKPRLTKPKPWKSETLKNLYPEKSRP